jgi:ParB-like chromosome segregation protein Spo0J
MPTKVKISEVKNNPNNPRLIKDDKFKKLVQSLKDLPEMAEVRPIVVNTDMVVLGGNMRLKAMKEAGWKEVPVEVVDWDEDKQKQFIIKDNVGFGEWDWEQLANEWDAEELDAWGLDVPDEKEKIEQGEIHFSEELDRVSNYVVLKFTNDIDFLNIQTILGLKSTYSKRANGKPWSKGLGRVVDGIDALVKIKES